jgi:hypothetical protein
VSKTPYSDKIDKLSNLEILHGRDYPMKAGFLIAEANFLRRTIVAIRNRITDIPNYIDDPTLEGIVYVAEDALDDTAYLVADAPTPLDRALSQQDRTLPNGKVKTATGYVEDGHDYDARDFPDGIG